MQNKDKLFFGGIWLILVIVIIEVLMDIESPISFIAFCLYMFMLGIMVYTKPNTKFGKWLNKQDMNNNTLALIVLFVGLIGVCAVIDFNRKPKSITINNCEYLQYNGFSLTHKGNCKYCTEKRKQEYVEIIDSLFNLQN